MNNSSYIQFPWLKYLLSNLGWALLAMLLLGVLIWYFGYDQIEAHTNDASPITSLALSLFYDLIFALVFLIPSFYAGMGACVWLEKHRGKYQEQFETTFSIVYYAVFFAFLVVYGIWIYFHFEPNEASIVTLFNPLRLLIVGYIFHGNVEDNLWYEIFEKRE